MAYERTKTEGASNVGVYSGVCRFFIGCILVEVFASSWRNLPCRRLLDAGLGVLAASRLDDSLSFFGWGVDRVMARRAGSYG